jgi:hypothetical protein
MAILLFDFGLLALSTLPPRSHPPASCDQGHHEHDQKYQEQNFCDAGGGSGDAGKAQQSCDDGYY